MKYLGAGFDVGATKITTVADGAAPDDAAAFGQVNTKSTYGLDPRSISGHESLATGQDWTAGLQAANDQLAATGGGVVLLPPFSINLASDLLLDSHIVLQGQGRTASVIVSTGGAIKSRNFNTLTGGDTGSGESSIGLREFTFDGNKASVNAVTLPHGVAMYGATMHVYDIVIRECAGIGLKTEYASTGNAYGPDGPPDGWPVGSRFDGMLLIDNDQGNWKFDGSHDAIATKIISVLQTVTGGPQVGLVGVKIDNAAGAGLQLSDSHFWGGDQEVCLHIGAGSCRLDNVVLEGATDAQLAIDSSGGVQGSNLQLFGQNGANQQIGIRLIQCGSARITGRMSKLPGGCIKFNGNTGDTQGDFGNNYFDFTCNIDNAGQGFPNPLYVGTPNTKTSYRLVCDTSGIQDGSQVVNSLNVDLGFYGSTPAAQQSAATLADLWAGLTNYGLLDGASVAPAEPANERAQALLWNGSAWLNVDGETHDGNSSAIYLQKTGDPDPSGVMVAGDIRISQ